MRRLWAGSLGVGLAVAGSTAVGQDAAPRPAAKFGVIRAVSAEKSGVTARSQAADPPKPMPMPVPTPPAAGTLNMPRSFNTGPGVTEQRNVTPPPPTLFGGPPPTYGPQPTFSGPAGGMPVGAVPYDPAAYPAPGPGVPDGGMFPAPDLEAPLYGGGGGYPGVVTGGAVLCNKWYASAEYLMWWTRSERVPALLTTSSPQFNGIVGQGDTRVVFGDGSFAPTRHSGGRFGVGYWFGTEQRWGVDGNFFFLGRNGTEFRTDTNAYPLLARPFVSTNTGGNFSELVAVPGQNSGSAAVVYNNSVWGADANLRRFLAKTNCARLDLIGGFRYMSLDEGLGITENFARLPGNPPAIGVPVAASGTVTDDFRTRNRFYGAQVGLLGEVRRGRWFANGTGKVGFGTAFQTSEINGSQDILFTNGVRAVNAGGLLALPGANIGTHTRNKFAVLPEVGFNIGYHVTPHLRVFVGYNFLYLSSVLRPGDQIDTGLDTTRIPNFPVAGATRQPFTRPVPTFRDSDFFAQGLSFGMQFNW